MRTARFQQLPRRSESAFTLVELMIAVGLGSLVLAAVASLTVFGMRSSVALVNYTDLDSKSRYGLDVIGREIRDATAVAGIASNATLEELRLTNSVDGTWASIVYDPVARQVTLSRSGQADLVALSECDRFSFGLYQRTPWVTPTNILFYPATNTSGALDLRVCKLVNLYWKCSRQILAQKVNTESVQAAQIVLRNKQ